MPAHMVSVVLWMKPGLPVCQEDAVSTPPQPRLALLNLPSFSSGLACSDTQLPSHHARRHVMEPEQACGARHPGICISGWVTMS